MTRNNRNWTATVPNCHHLVLLRRFMNDTRRVIWTRSSVTIIPNADQ